MKIPIFMIFQFFGIISRWAVKALEDGKVTAAEGLILPIVFLNSKSFMSLPALAPARQLAMRQSVSQLSSWLTALMFYFPSPDKRPRRSIIIIIELYPQMFLFTLPACRPK